MAARSTFKISDEVRDVLARSTITATSVALPEQLERKLYEAVNKALTGAGGKWNKKAKAHVFDRDPREVLGLAEETGQAVNLRTKLQAFYTPPELAKKVAAAAKLKHERKVLEPSCGEGALALAALRVAAVHVSMCDSDPVALERAEQATRQLAAEVGGSTSVMCRDFLEVPVLREYDAVLMNPPFTGGADIKHVNHAWLFLEPGGVLVAIMSPHYRHAGDIDSQRFRKFLAATEAEEEDIPAGTFEHTNIATVMLTIRKPR